MTKFFTGVLTVNATSCVRPYLPILTNKSTGTATVRLEFRKMLSAAVGDKDICTKFGEKMLHGHAEMIT